MTKEIKRPVGRPSKYTPEILKKAEEYLEQAKDGYATITKKALDNGIMRDVPMATKLIVNLPSLIGLASYLDVTRQTLSNWGAEHKDFLGTLDAVKREEEKTLLFEGLAGNYNSNIVKLALGNFGYHEKKEMFGKDGKDLISIDAKEKGKEAVKSFLNRGNTGEGE